MKTPKYFIYVAPLRKCAALSVQCTVESKQASYFFEGDNLISFAKLAS